MKKELVFVLMVAILFAITTPVFAGEIIPTNLEVFDETELGAKIDLPELIKISEDSSIGVEAGVYDLHQDWKDSSFAFVKFTSKWSLFDFSK